MKSQHVQSYYTASAQRIPSYPELLGDQTADVCVIGAGYTGLSAALELAEKGYSVAVVEGNRVGWGASGRNGGQICTAYTRSMADTESLAGREAAQVCWDISEAGKDLIRQRVNTYGIDCDLKWGYLHAATKPRHLDGLKSTQSEWNRYGGRETRLLDKAQLEERLGSTAYHGALWESNAGHFHPLNYALGLARALTAKGGLIFENSPVVRVDDGANPAVHTATGAIRARYVVVAGNAYLGRLVPHLYHRLMPVGSYILATEPLDEETATSLIRDDDAVANSSFIVDYYRLSADRRMLFGGRASYSGYEPKDLFAYMRPRMLKVFPQLKDVRLDYCWGGNIGIALNRMPHVGRLGNTVFYAQAYSGHGVALSGMCGKLIADAIMGTAERFDVLAAFKHQPFPGGPVRTPMLTLGMLYYRLRDLLA